MQISLAIMGHLAATREKQAYRRNERVTRGLGSFIEGKSTLAGWEHAPNVGAFAIKPGSKGLLDKTQQRLERQENLQEQLPQPYREVSSVASAADAAPRSINTQGRALPTPSDASPFVCFESRHQCLLV